MWFCIVFLGLLKQFLNSSIVFLQDRMLILSWFLVGFLNVIVHENSWCKLIFFKIRGPYGDQP